MTTASFTKLLLLSLVSSCCVVPFSVHGFVISRPKNAALTTVVVVDTSAAVAVESQTVTRRPPPCSFTRLFYDKQPGDEAEAEGSNDNKRHSSSTRPSNRDANNNNKKNKKDKSDSTLKSPFATGSVLQRLRQDLASFRENLEWAEAIGDSDRMTELSAAIKQGQQLDPDFVYGLSLQQIAELQGRSDLGATEKSTQLLRLREKAQEARLCLPQFHLEGLWVGTYGKNGDQLINITYSGDSIVATKVTGDANVPRKQVTFTANLAPDFKAINKSNNNTAVLRSPLKIPSNTKTSFTRFAGQGKVAKPGYTDSKYVDGQLILMENAFSFVWMPAPRHYVLFRRPTAQQTLNLLRNVLSHEDELQNIREHLTKCLDMDMTDSIARFHARGADPLEPFRRISSVENLQVQQQKQRSRNSGKHAERNLFGITKASSSSLSLSSIQPWKFMQVHRWKRYIDTVLGSSDEATEYFQ